MIFDIFISPLISIHTLRVEGDANGAVSGSNIPQFQSTPSVWRVTFIVELFCTVNQFQSTPSVWRVTFGQN